MRVSTKALIKAIKECKEVNMVHHGENYTACLNISKAQMLREIDHIEKSNDVEPIWDIDIFEESKRVDIN